MIKTRLEDNYIINKKFSKKDKKSQTETNTTTESNLSSENKRCSEKACKVIVKKLQKMKHQTMLIH